MSMASPADRDHATPVSVLTPASASMLAAAAADLAAGHLVAFPTETVYGLGARADDDAAVAQIFAAKGRPAHHPLIVHVADVAGAQAFAASCPPVAQRLMAAFWPGPLTVIVPRHPDRAGAAAGGQDTVGLRCPSHPVAQALLREAATLGVLGVAAPSANRFGHISPTRADHVRAELGAELTVLDGGECDVGIESCIVDCSRGHPVLLRPGVLTVAQIEAAAGEPLRAPDAQAPRASGTLVSHYAPRATLRLMSTAQLQSALAVWAGPGPAVFGAAPSTPVPTPTLAIYARGVPTSASPGAMPGWVYRPMPAQPLLAAHQLFADLRELDALGVSLIWVESPPDTPEWQGVLDRLTRAAA